MSTDGRMIEDGSGGQDELMVTSQQLKLARDRSREKIRRIVAIVSVALTLLAILLVTAFLALGSKLEKESERNANQGGRSPFADDSQKIDDAVLESSTDSSPSPKDIIEAITRVDRDRKASETGSSR